MMAAVTESLPSDLEQQRAHEARRQRALARAFLAAAQPEHPLHVFGLRYLEVDRRRRRQEEQDSSA